MTQKLLFPSLIDQRAASGDYRPYALVPHSPNVDSGFSGITYRAMANAINRTCWWLESNLERQDRAVVEKSSFAYIGQNDLRYVIFLAAAMKTGYKMLVPSPRNTTTAQIALLKKVGCKVLITCTSLSLGLSGFLDAAQNEGVIRILAPSLVETLDENIASHYAFTESIETVAERPVLVIHTSGSSGDPKPIIWNHSFLHAALHKQSLPKEQGTSLIQECIEHQNVLMLMPCFHAAGIICSAWPPTWNMTLMLPHPDVPLSHDHVARLLKQGVATSLITAPTFLESLSQDTSALGDLRKLKHIAYSGGPLRPDIVHQLSPIVQHLFSLIGATENGWLHCVSGSNDYSSSIRFYTDIGYQFEEVAPGQFEMIIINDNNTNHYHGVFSVFPSLAQYRTRDIYVVKPGSKGWWTYRGRADDLIVLSNGEKINPIPMENVIASHPMIKAVLMAGEHRFSPSLLVELNDERYMEVDNSQFPGGERIRKDIIRSIWPKIEEANKIAPGFAKIYKSLIIFTSPDKPFLRAGKGTIQRQATTRYYSTEIGDLARDQENFLFLEGLDIPEQASVDDIRRIVRQIFSQTLDSAQFGDTDDVFHLGMDSLKVSIVAQRLRAALDICRFLPTELMSHVGHRLVYSCPSVGSLTVELARIKGCRAPIAVDKLGCGGPCIDNNNAIDHSTTDRMQRQVKLRNLLWETSLRPDAAVKDKILSKNINGMAKPWNIIITGTTGTFGSYLLSALEALPESHVGKIFCLYRSAGGRERQMAASSARGLNSSWPKKANSMQRVWFLDHVELSEPNFGLEVDTYRMLLDEATVIVHAAWKVDFNLDLSSFEPYIRGVRNLLEFSAKSAHQAVFVFISSISTTFGWQAKHPQENVPEDIIHDWDSPQGMGYSESKFISELLIETIARTEGLTTAILRTGQIAGPAGEINEHEYKSARNAVGTNRVCWNKKEWFPSLVATSKYINALPTSLGNMDDINWIPADILAVVTTEILGSIIQKKRPLEIKSDTTSKRGQTLVYNLVNPQTTKWANVFNVVQEVGGIDNLLPLHEWVASVEKSTEDGQETVCPANPAVKLLDFFRGLKKVSVSGNSKTPMLRYNVSKLVSDSCRAAKMTAVSEEWVRHWMEQWDF